MMARCLVAAAAAACAAAGTTGVVASRGAAGAPDAYRLVRPDALRAYLDFDDAGELGAASTSWAVPAGAAAGVSATGASVDGLALYFAGHDGATAVVPGLDVGPQAMPSLTMGGWVKAVAGTTRGGTNSSGGGPGAMRFALAGSSSEAESDRALGIRSLGNEQVILLFILQRRATTRRCGGGSKAVAGGAKYTPWLSRCCPPPPCCHTCHSLITILMFILLLACASP